MASIADIMYAAYTVANSAEYIQVQSIACAENLKRHAERLAVVGRGSSSASDAVRRVAAAQRAVEQSAAALLGMRNNATRFIAQIRQ